MEFHAFVFRTHQAGPDDTTPLEMISAERLAQLLAIEAAARVLAAAVPPDPSPPAPQ